MKRIAIRVSPRARENRVVELSTGLTVRVTVPAHGGQANAAVIKLLSRFFDVPQSAVTIWRGAASRQKIVQIDE